MTIDEFLKKHDMTAYQFAKLTGWPQSQISRFRSGKVVWSKPHDFLLDALDFAIEYGFKNNHEGEKMKFTTNFDEWFEHHNLDFEGLHSLYCLLKYGQPDGAFGYEKKNDGRILITTWDQAEPGLLLASDDAKKKFLDRLDEPYVESIGGIESEYGFRKAMGKNDDNQ